MVTSQQVLCSQVQVQLHTHQVQATTCPEHTRTSLATPFQARSHHAGSHSAPLVTDSKRVTYKLATLTFKAFSSDEPSYLRSLLITHQPARNLRSSTLNSLTVTSPRTNLSSRAFRHSEQFLEQFTCRHT